MRAYSQGCDEARVRFSPYPNEGLGEVSEVSMSRQPKSSGRRRISAKDRELEELLRRAAVYSKNRALANLRVVRRKRVKAA